MERFWRWLVLFAASLGSWVFFRALNRLRIEGLPSNLKLTPGRTVVFYANHRSHTDPFLILFGCLSNPLQSLCGKTQACWSVAYAGHLNGWKSWFIKPARIVAHESWAPGIEEKLAATVKRGENILIFPEGRRHLGEEYADLAPFRKGLAWLAKNHDVFVVPVALIGTGKLLPPRSRFPRLGQRLKAVFGEPVPSAIWHDATTKEITNDLAARLKTLLRAVS